METRTFEKIVYGSAAMQRVVELTRRVAQSGSDALIIGETGTGKELIADAVHKQGRRNEKALEVIDCGSIPQQLITSELFGHERGSFTGATDARKGRFELGNGGVVFLDEISHMPLEHQPFLLRVLENRCIQRVGGKNRIPLDVQVISATNRDLLDEVESGAFLRDLYYRLAIVTVKVPPLRERREDITTLAVYFLRGFSRKYRAAMKEIHPGVMRRFLRYEWRGNVRELCHVIENCVVIFGEEETLMPHHLPEGIDWEAENLCGYGAHGELAKSRRNSEILRIQHELQRTRSNVSLAARNLQCSRSTLYRKIKMYDISVVRNH